MYYDSVCNCCDRKARVACAQSIALWQQATIEITWRDHSIIACSCHEYIVFFFVHIPFVLNRTFQPNASRVVATTSPPFYNELHWSHVLCVKAEPGTTFTSPFCCDRKARAACAQTIALCQQATIEITRRDHFIIACSCHACIVLFFVHIPFVLNRTFQRSGCNTTCGPNMARN